MKPETCLCWDVGGVLGGSGVHLLVGAVFTLLPGGVTSQGGTVTEG